MFWHQFQGDPCHGDHARHGHEGPFHKGGEQRHARDGFGRMFGHGHHHFGGKFGRGRMGRFFEHGDLRYVILRLIADKPRYGYEVIKEIEEQLHGAYSPSPGVVYPTLTLLEELGYATVSAAEGGKKLYAITPDGTAFLEANRSMVDNIFTRMAENRAAQGGALAPQVLRAMENLKMAIRLRFMQEPLTEEQIRRVAAAIDAAAQDIERI